MGRSGKKQYEKPTLTKVSLDAKCAVLGFCKTTAKVGAGQPAINGCKLFGSNCLSQGS